MEELTGLDARFLYSETSTTHMHTLKVVVLDTSRGLQALTGASFAALFLERIDRLPPFRRRAVPVPFHLGHPVWVDDPDFDIAGHVEWLSAPSPGGPHELASVISEIASVPLRRDRPLWNVTVVDQLAGGELAVVVKLHHCLADGGAAVALLQNAFMADDADAVTWDHAPEQIPSRRALVAEAARSGARRFAALPSFVREATSGLTAASRAERAAPVRTPRPFSAPRTPFNVSLSPERTYAMASLSLAELKLVRRVFATTLNDVYLAACGGALRRYLERRGSLPARSLLASVPLASGAAGPYLQGNHTDNMFVALRTDLPDPVARLAAIHAAASSAKQVRDSLGKGLLERRATFAPPHLYTLGPRVFGRTHLADRLPPPVNLIASNVAGPAQPLDLNGSVVTALYSVGPILEGIGLNITAWSYVDEMNVSVLGCRRSLPDPWELIADVEHSAAELTRAARGSGEGG